MLKRVWGWVGDFSWALLLTIIAAAYWLSPRDWWATITFFCVGALYIVLVTAHTLEYWRIQRKLSYLLFAIAKLCFGLALLIGALVTVPLHVYDFSTLRIVSRWLWAIGLPAWVVAVITEWRRVYRLWRERE